MAARLAEACRHPSHAVWSAPISLLDEGLIRRESLLDSQQITEAHLLALAVTQGGHFATFQQRLERVGVPVVPAACRANLCASPATDHPVPLPLLCRAGLARVLA